MVFPISLPEETLGEMPLFKSDNFSQVLDMMFTITMTPNVNFNQSLFDTLGNIESKDVRQSLIGSFNKIDSNMLRVKVDPITKVVSKIDIDYTFIDYDLLLENIIKNSLAYINDILTSPKDKIKAKAVHEEYINFYNNYNNMIKESITT